MTPELETGLPSIIQIQTLIKENTEVELKVSTGDLLAGKIRWQDPYCLAILDQYDQVAIVWRTAIVYLKPKT